MLLAIDIGNTNITLGLFQNKRLVNSWRMETRLATTSDEYGIKIQDLFHYSKIASAKVTDIAVASVVPPLARVFEELSWNYFHRKAYGIEPEHCGIKIMTDHPQEVGADRIVNVAAVHELENGPAIVVDFGTATTFDCCSAKGEYLGGAIALGPALAAESLAAHTAQLPHVRITKPRHALGRNTKDCIRSGLYYGYLGLIEEILRRLIREMPGRPKVVATGGLAKLIVPETRLIQKIIPDLTLQGIRILFEKRRRV